MENSTDISTIQEKVDQLNAEARRLLKHSTRESIETAQEANRLSDENQYFYGAALANKTLGVAYRNSGDFASALQYHDKSLKLYEQLDDWEGQANNLNNIGTVYKSLGDYSQALEHHMLGLKLFEKYEHLLGQARCFNNIGLVYKNNKEYHKSLEYYDKSLKLHQECEEKQGQGNCYNNMGNAYVFLEQYDEALKYHLKSYEIKKEMNDEFGISSSLINIGVAHFHRKEYDKALKYAYESISMHDERVDKHSLTYCYECIGNTLLAQEKTEEALEPLFKGLNYSLEINAIDRIAAFNRMLYRGHKTLGMAKEALTYHEQYQENWEQLFKKSSDEKMKNLEVSYRLDVAQKEAEIHRLNHEELKQAYEKLQTTQEQLIVQEKLASLGQLTAGIAHEIKNPLNFINNFSAVSVELLEELLEDYFPEETREKNLSYGAIAEQIDIIKSNIDKIVVHGKRADNIVQGMLKHSRDKDDEAKPADVNELIEENLVLAYHGWVAKNKAFTVDVIKKLGDNLPQVALSHQDVSRVIINLLNNAFYALNEWKNKQPNSYKPEVLIETLRDDTNIVIRITDNGPGIPETIRKEVFNPFFTTKPTGEGNTGLGLSLSHDIIVKGHDGSFELETEVSKFTRFVIKIPLSQPQD